MMLLYPKGGTGDSGPFLRHTGCTFPVTDVCTQDKTNVKEPELMNACILTA